MTAVYLAPELLGEEVGGHRRQPGEHRGQEHADVPEAGFRLEVVLYVVTVDIIRAQCTSMFS